MFSQAGLIFGGVVVRPLAFHLYGSEFDSQ